MKIIIYLIFQYDLMLKLCPVVSAILDFWLTQKHTHLVKDHQRNTPSMISVKCFKKKRTLLCGDGLLGFFFQLKLHWKPIFLNVISIEKPLELNLKSIGFYLKLHWKKNPSNCRHYPIKSTCIHGLVHLTGYI